MSLQKINTRTIVLILMIVAAAAMRLITYKLSLKYPYEMSNFTPFGAIALFGGAYFMDKWKAYLIVLLTLFLSDILINYLRTSNLTVFHSSSMGLYLAFAIMVLLGSFIKKVNIASVGIASLVAVAVHWLITDLPWLYDTLYAHNLTGYGQSLAAALPFERNMIFADVLFCAILFGGFELAKRKYTFLRAKGELAV